jgi:hypothetical protein
MRQMAEPTNTANNGAKSHPGMVIAQRPYSIGSDQPSRMNHPNTSPPARPVSAMSSGLRRCHGGSNSRQSTGTSSVPNKTAPLIASDFVSASG